MHSFPPYTPIHTHPPLHSYPHTHAHSCTTQPSTYHARTHLHAPTTRTQALNHSTPDTQSKHTHTQTYTGGGCLRGPADHFVLTRHESGVHGGRQRAKSASGRQRVLCRRARVIWNKLFHSTDLQNSTHGLHGALQTFIFYYRLGRLSAAHPTSAPP